MNREIYGVVYKLTNKINGKIYIGSSVDLRKRIISHTYESKNGKLPINLAIKEYGKENFSYEIICECDNKEKLESYEYLFIELYRSYDSNIGYNRVRKINGKITFPKNRGYKRSDSKSKYLGVGYRDKFYVSKVYTEDKDIYIGCFENEIDAAKARDIIELEYFGNNAILNFPELMNDYISGKIKVKRIIKTKSNDSNIKNVFLTRKQNPWEVDIRNKKLTYRSSFKTKQEAEEKAIELHKQIGSKNYYKDTDPFIVYKGIDRS